MFLKIKLILIGEAKKQKSFILGSTNLSLLEKEGHTRNDNSDESRTMPHYVTRGQYFQIKTVHVLETKKSKGFQEDEGESTNTSECRLHR